MSDNWNAEGPIVVWINYGCEGWSPRSYPTLVAAISQHRSDYDFVVTKVLKAEDFVKEPEA